MAEVRRLHGGSSEPDGGRSSGYLTAGLTLLTIAISVATGAASTAYILGGNIAKLEVRTDVLVSVVDRDHRETNGQVTGLLEAVGRLSIQTASNTTAIQTATAQINSLIRQIEDERKERIELERRLFVRPPR